VNFKKLIAAASVAFALMLSPALHASDASDADSVAAEEKARNYFTNLEVIDQDGRKLKFYDDVLKDKVVAINFIFTNCQGACPLMTRHLTLVRDLLGPDVGSEIHFVQTHDADQDYWRFVTGNPKNLEYIVKKLGQYNDDVEAHSTLLLAANVRTAHWTKIPPNVPPNGVVERLRMLVEEDAAN